MIKLRQLINEIREADEEHPEDEFNPEKDAQPPTDWSKVQFVKKDDPRLQGAKRMHLYPVQNVLRPRGPMKKESLSLEIYHALKGNFDYWTDKKYGDSLSPEKIISLLKQNLAQEVDTAWKYFIDGGNVDIDGI